MRRSEYFSDEFQNVLEAFRADKGNSRTYEEYVSFLNLICDYYGKDFLEITEADAASYFHKLEERIIEGSLSSSTFCARLSCYRSMGKYVMDNYPDIPYQNSFLKIVRPEVDHSITEDQIPSLEELDKILSSAKEISPMDYLIVALATRMCLSAIDIVRLDKGHVFQDNGRIRLILEPTKGSKKPVRYVTVPDDVTPVLKEYMQELSSGADNEGYDEQGHLFYNEWHRPLRPRNLDSRFKKVLKQSGVNKSYTMKDLRTRGLLELTYTSADIDDIQTYANIGPQRMADYLKSEAYIENSCPPNLVNYQLASKNVEKNAQCNAMGE